MKLLYSVENALQNYSGVELSVTLTNAILPTQACRDAIVGREFRVSRARGIRITKWEGGFRLALFSTRGYWCERKRIVRIWVLVM